jgi:hypothetical protein
MFRPFGSTLTSDVGVPENAKESTEYWNRGSARRQTLLPADEQAAGPEESKQRQIRAAGVCRAFFVPTLIGFQLPLYG